MCSALSIIGMCTQQVSVYAGYAAYCDAGSILAIQHGQSMARVTAPSVLGETALLAALAKVPASRPLTYRCGTESPGHSQTAALASVYAKLCAHVMQHV
jgi:hypothetical protein